MKDLDSENGKVSEDLPDIKKEEMVADPVDVPLFKALLGISEEERHDLIPNHSE